MPPRITILRLVVDGMTCSHCETTIEKAVGAIEGVTRVRASAPLSEVMVYHEAGRVTREQVVAAIIDAGYTVRGSEGEPKQAGPRTAAQETAHDGTPVVERPPSADGAAARAADASPAAARPVVTRILGLLALVAAAFLVAKATGGASFLPTVSQNMGYGLLFVVGLLTSLHCVAMCGGIVLSQGVKREDGGEVAGAVETPSPGAHAAEVSVPGASKAHAAEVPTPAAPKLRPRDGIVPSLLYNAGRVVSYTVIGGIVGALGSLFSLTTALKGAMPIVAGAFMAFLGIRMLGIFPALSRLRVRLPSIGGGRLRKLTEGRGPFVIGLLNGLMPCGPLQTMQVYALGTGSFVAGALSMLVFSLGTVPLLLGFGAISAFLSARFHKWVLKASGALVVVLGLVMLTRGMSLFGVSLPTLRGAPAAVAVATVADGVQTVRTTVTSSSYEPLVVQAGIPVRWTLSAGPDDLNGCNGTIIVPQYGIRQTLSAGDTLVEFTPTRTGTIAYTCWMGMITSTITVVSDVTKLSDAERLAAATPSRPSYTSPSGASPGGGAGGGCCGVPPAGFAGGKIPVDTIEIAHTEAGGQVADITVDDRGYTPAVVIMKRGVKGKVRFIASRISSCTSVVSFPDYQGSLNLSAGQLETPFLEITGDFGFQCGMGMLHGYVKVVDDPSKVDIAAVKREVAAIRPAAGSGGGCCGQ